MDIAEIIFTEFTKDNRKKSAKDEFVTKEKKFIDKLSVADARDYYEIVEEISNRNSREQLELVKFVINFYKQMLSSN